MQRQIHAELMREANPNCLVTACADAAAAVSLVTRANLEGASGNRPPHPHE